MQVSTIITFDSCVGGVEANGLAGRGRVGVQYYSQASSR